MNRIKRLTALFLAAAMVITIAFSVLFVVHKAEHHCTGVDCQICEQVNICLHFLDDFAPKPQSSPLLVSAVFTVVLCLGCIVYFEKLNTLVYLKVKLSD